MQANCFLACRLYFEEACSRLRIFFDNTVPVNSKEYFHALYELPARLRHGHGC